MKKQFTFTAIALLIVVSVFAQNKKKPNILVIWGDDIGTWNISHNNRGMMGYKTPNIDKLASSGVRVGCFSSESHQSICDCMSVLEK